MKYDDKKTKDGADMLSTVLGHSDLHSSESLVSQNMSYDKNIDEPQLDHMVQKRIGAHLRALYDDLVQQPIPDRFIEMLNRLDEKKLGSANEDNA